MSGAESLMSKASTALEYSRDASNSWSTSAGFSAVEATVPCVVVEGVDCGTDTNPALTNVLNKAEILAVTLADTEGTGIDGAEGGA